MKNVSFCTGLISEKSFLHNIERTLSKAGRTLLGTMTAILLLLSTAHGAIDDHVYEYGEAIPSTFRHFVQVMGAQTPTAAEVLFDCVRRTQPTVSVGIFKIPAPGGYRPEFPYSIVVGSYLTSQEADLVLGKTRTEFDYASVASCLGVSNSVIPDAVKRFHQDTFRFSLNVPVAKWERSIKLSPVKSFNGIGTIRTRSDNSPRNAIVEGKAYGSAQAVSAAISSYQGRYSDITFAAIHHGSRYFVAVTSIVGNDGLRDAIHAMRKRGAYALATRATFMDIETKIITDDSVAFQDLLGNTVQASTSVNQPSALQVTTVLDPVDLFESPPDRVRRCLSGRTFSIAANVRELASCTGIVFTPWALTRCLSESECHGLRVPIGFTEPEDNLVRTCLGIAIPGTDGGDGQPTKWRDPITACQATLLDPTFRAIVDKIGMKSCYSALGTPQPIVGTASANSDCVSAKTALRELCADPKNKALCDAAPKVVEEVQQRAAAVEECLLRKKCGLIVPRPPAVKAAFAAEIARLNMSIEDTVKVTKDAFGKLGAQTDHVTAAFKECISVRDSGNVAKAQECFISLGLSVNEGSLLKCIDASSDPAAKTACITNQLGGNWPAIATRADCARKASGSTSALAACFSGDAAALASTYQCAASKTSPLDAAISCSGALSPDVANSLQCARNQSDLNGYLGCLPNLGEKEKAALCLTNASSDAERASCIASIVPMDPKTALLVGCVAQSNGEAAAMAACAITPNLPPEVAKAAQCASSSTGATDFALCATGSGLNPELRIAAECAVSTGGEPISFASCSAGRLTARELGKCLSGEIGKDGGCFGPNNDLVKAFNTQINDLLHGPGPNNDIVNALAPVTAALADIGRNVSSALRRAEDDFKRGDIGRTICGWLGC